MSETTAIELKPKTKLSGRVLKTSLAGAILDVGQDLPAVVHISQISKGPINRVDEVLKPGQTVEVWVKRVRKDRIEVTMIEPLAYEWKEIKPDLVVTGKVVRIEDYGIFVDFGAERPGMVHISELTRGYVKHPSEVVKEGDEVEAKVLEVNRKKKQIRLSMKALMPEKIVVEEVPVQEGKKARKGKRGKKQQVQVKEVSMPQSQESKSEEPELTAMQIAWQMAMERARVRNKALRTKPLKLSEEQEEIVSRTLEKQLPAGG